MSGTNIVGVQFRRAGKIYDFNAKNFLLALGDKVVVETERGPSLAEVMRLSYADELVGGISKSLKSVIRVAGKSDLDFSGRLSEDKVRSYTAKSIKSLNLDMSLIGVDLQLGGSKVIIFFSAPGRVDFRELVKDLASGLKTRVELKQVGARDEAKQVGGLGICGREFCCSSFLREFVPVSIKMAKNQNLALNPSKVSGGCGRLLCCLTYEDDTYRSLKLKLPPNKSRVKLESGVEALVIKGDILNQQVMVETEIGELLSVPISEVEKLGKRQAAKPVSEAADDDWAEDIDVTGLLATMDSKQANKSDKGGGAAGGSRRSGANIGDRGVKSSQGSPQKDSSQAGSKAAEDANRKRRNRRKRGKGVKKDNG